MKIDSREHATYGWRCIDAATGALLKYVVAVDDVAKEMVVIEVDDQGHVKHDGREIAYKTVKLRAAHIDVATKIIKIYRVAP